MCSRTSKKHLFANVIKNRLDGDDNHGNDFLALDDNDDDDDDSKSSLLAPRCTCLASVLNAQADAAAVDVNVIIISIRLSTIHNYLISPDRIGSNRII